MSAAVWCCLIQISMSVISVLFRNLLNCIPRQCIWNQMCAAFERSIRISVEDFETKRFVRWLFSAGDTVTPARCDGWVSESSRVYSADPRNTLSLTSLIMLYIKVSTVCLSSGGQFLSTAGDFLLLLLLLTYYRKRQQVSRTSLPHLQVHRHMLFIDAHIHD